MKTSKQFRIGCVEIGADLQSCFFGIAFVERCYSAGALLVFRFAFFSLIVECGKPTTGGYSWWRNGLLNLPSTNDSPGAILGPEALEKELLEIRSKKP